MHKTIKKVDARHRGAALQHGDQRHDDPRQPPRRPAEPSPREARRALALLVSPFAPHLGEELWTRSGTTRRSRYVPWPTSTRRSCSDDVVEIGVQVNGKVRGRVTLPRAAPEDEAREAALAEPTAWAARRGQAGEEVHLRAGQDHQLRRLTKAAWRVRCPSPRRVLSSCESCALARRARPCDLLTRLRGRRDELRVGERRGRARRNGRESIQGGVVDENDLAVVGVAVVGDDGGVEKTCSGVLIAPNLVLTAQHCVVSNPEFVSCDDASFGPPVDPARVYVTTDGSMWASGTTWLGVVDVSLPPGAPAVCGRDVALVTLEDPIGGVSPLEPSLGGPCQPTEGYTAIGYGAIDGGDDHAGVRRRRDGLAVVCVGGDCSSSNITGREWLGDHGICAGDSGSPAIDGDGRVFGITSRGPAGCDDPVYGGLVGHRNWLVRGAARAAKRGGFATPKWASDGAIAKDVSELKAANASSCSAAPGGASGDRLALAALAVLALALVRRRRPGSSNVAG